MDAPRHRPSASERMFLEHCSLRFPSDSNRCRGGSLFFQQRGKTRHFDDTGHIGVGSGNTQRSPGSGESAQCFEKYAHSGGADVVHASQIQLDVAVAAADHLVDRIPDMRSPVGIKPALEAQGVTVLAGMTDDFHVQCPGSCFVRGTTPGGKTTPKLLAASSLIHTSSCATLIMGIAAGVSPDRIRAAIFPASCPGT